MMDLLMLQVECRFDMLKLSNDGNGSADVLGERNRGPRTSISKLQLSVKAYTTKVGGCNEQGNIIIVTFGNWI